MSIILRPYQEKQINQARLAMRDNRFICIQSPTGSGKTVMFVSIINSAFHKNKVCWIIVPRNELLQQASEHLKRYHIPHNFISPGRRESKLFNVHIVSKDTLIRRWEHIKVWPDLIINDECHLNHTFQMDLLSRVPDYTRMIGYTATPERLDGNALSDIYSQLVIGPSIPELTQLGYLAPLRYFSPPIEGLDKIHRRGTEYDPDELEKLLETNKIYGAVIDHYKKHGAVRQTTISLPGQPAITTNQNYAKGRPALIFCRTVDSAYKTAEQFRNAGFKFECIEGKMPKGKRKQLIDALTNGQIDGLTNCELLTFGFDCPRVEYGASIRPTLSRALYFQMVGRILRPYTGKEFAMFFDHVNLYREHGEPVTINGQESLVPPFYLENIEWNFYGREKKKRDKKEIQLRCCPYDEFRYCDQPSCVGCPHNKDNKPDARAKDIEIVDIDLKEITEKPVPLCERAPEEKKEYQDRISKAVYDFEESLKINVLNELAVREMIKVADELGYSVMWCYHKLTQEKKSINVPLLNMIQKIKNYKRGWAWMKQKELANYRKVSVI